MNVTKVSKDEWCDKSTIVEKISILIFLTLKSPLKDHIRSQPMVPANSRYDYLQL
jgi:hypothetical protein